MKNTFIVLLLMLIITFSKLSAQTYVSGGIYTTTTWTFSNSPYIVQDSLTLFPNAVLTIEPGVTVKFEDGVRFEVRGSIIAHGTENDSIIFTSASSVPSQASWESLEVHPELGGSVDYSYVRTSYANYGLFISPNGIGNFPTSYATHCQFSNNRYGYTGYTVQSPAISIDSSGFINNYHGIDVANSTTTVIHCLFQSNYYGLYETENLNISQCTFCGNYYGIGAHYGSFDQCVIVNNIVGTISTSGYSGYTMTNSVIAYNDTGIILHYNTTEDYTFENDDICNNYFYDVVHQGQYNIDMSGVCWCDTNQSNISALIYDGYDNSNYGLVMFNPVVICNTSVLDDLPSCPSYLGIENTMGQTVGALIFPNPTSTTITLSLPSNQNAMLSIFNLLGEKVKEEKVRGKKITLDVSSLSQGLYLVRTENRVVGKFVKE